MQNLNQDHSSPVSGPNSKKSLNETIHIDRKPSTVLMVIERIYNPIAEKMGISLLLRNEIDTEIQFPTKFFINLIQITGNLVANAVKFTSPNGFVDVVFTTKAADNHSTLNMTVTDTGNFLSPDLVSAFNKGKKISTLMGSNGELDFGFRLEYVLQLVSEEGGRIFINSGNEAGTKISLSLPLPNRYFN